MSDEARIVIDSRHVAPAIEETRPDDAPYWIGCTWQPRVVSDGPPPTLTITRPSGIEVSGCVVDFGNGRHALIPLDEVGVWRLRAEAYGRSATASIYCEATDSQ